jgi:S1-C subfamily serine protease
VTALDWLAIGLVLVLALAGAARGLVAGVLATAGVVAGAYIGSKLAPYVLPGGSDSAYTPVVTLAGAVFLAVVLEGLGALLGGLVRARMRLKPLRALDTAGGLVLGAATALAVVWIIGVMALHLPGQPGLRREAQRSYIIRRLTDVVSPQDVLSALARVDPFPEILGPLAQVEPPDRGVLRDPDIRRASQSVVRIVGTACGLGVVGSGWIARPGVVVTAAHVVAGQGSPTVEAPGQILGVQATPVAFDPKNDVAVLRAAARELPGRPLPIVDANPGAPVAIVGYPENHGLTETPGRMGDTTKFFTLDAYGRGPVLRTITAIRGTIRPGNSGGPAIDARGRVETTVFAARVDTDGGYGVPSSIVRDALTKAGGRVSTGPCAR